jgi:hypothetical protein
MCIAPDAQDGKSRERFRYLLDNTHIRVTHTAEEQCQVLRAEVLVHLSSKNKHEVSWQ